jgi:hypothetical protein
MICMYGRLTNVDSQCLSNCRLTHQIREPWSLRKHLPGAWYLRDAVQQSDQAFDCRYWTNTCRVSHRELVGKDIRLVFFISQTQFFKMYCTYYRCLVRTSTGDTWCGNGQRKELSLVEKPFKHIPSPSI